MPANDRIKIESGGEPCIRGLGITVWEIYRKLTLLGMTDQEVLRDYSALVPEDLPAVLDFVKAEIESRATDELTGRPILPKYRLGHGHYYKGRCHYATIARWN